MFSTRIRELREESDLRQEDIAEILGIARTTYASYEQGKKEPDYSILIKISKHFKVTTDYLLGLTNVPYNESILTNDEIEYIYKSLDLYRTMKKKNFE